MNGSKPDELSGRPQKAGAQQTSLRLLQVNSVFNGGGADRQTIELTAGLRDLGCEVTLAIAQGSRWEPLAHQLGVRVETFPGRSRLNHAMLRRLLSLLREGRIQILQAHQGRDYWPAILAARFAGCGTRVIVSRHLMTRPRCFSRQFLLSTGDVVAVSRAVLGVLRRELRGPASRLHQIYGGVDTAAFHPERTGAGRAFRQQYGWSNEAVVFGVVGSYGLPRGKGQLEFLEAAARLRREFPQARFAIVGRGSMELLLRERIAALGLNAAVAMVPFTDEVSVVMNALDVLVHPALGTEALGLVLWEAMACAKPVVASRLDGIAEAFVEGEHGWLVPPADVAALAEAMRVLLQHPAQRARFGAAGREHVCRNFSRARQAEQFQKLYANLLHW